MPSSQKTAETSALSRDEFILNLNQSGLSVGVENTRNITALFDSDTNADGNALARSLTDAGALTNFQANAICQGRQAELSIGAYEVIDKLGVGGMGTVFKARHRRMKRTVALKVLARHLTGHQAFVQRFQREVETIARLSHPNVVMAYDADEAEVGLYLVMEFVDGQDLNTLVEKNGPMAVADAVDCILQTARGLEYAHSQGIIHRDIKPANLLRDGWGVVKVTDLGLARFNTLGNDPDSGDSNSITQAGAVLGTANFMPPEQAVDSTDIDHRADIYSLGCTLYFLIQGKAPFECQTLVATLLKHREGPIPSLSEGRSDVPAELEAVFRRMVAKAPADRCQTMAEVVKAMESIQLSVGKATTAPPPTRVSTTTASPLDSTSIWQNEEPPSSIGKTPFLSETTALLPTASAIPQKVLLVEPSRTQAGIIRRYLQTHGVDQSVSVATGDEALKTTRTARPDVIVSAMYLADMTGVQLALRIVEECKENAPGFVLISSESDGFDVGSIGKCGRAVNLHKPFTPEQLVDALRVVAATSPVSTAAVATKPRSDLRVLVVDDSAVARRHVRSVLGGLGVTQFIEAADGAQAVAAVVGAAFDLIVTDYNMPFMDGRGLIGYLKQNSATASIPIILVTTEQDPQKLAEVRRLGVAAVCEKSFPADVVRKVVDQIECKS